MQRHRSVRRRLIVGVAALTLTLAAVPLVSTTVLAAPTSYGVNLVRNPGAEAGAGGDGYTVVSIPDWTTSDNFTVVKYGSTGFPTKAESSRIGGGKKFFSCGPNEDLSFAEQRIFIKGRGAAIDRGEVRVVVSVRQAGYLNGLDEASVWVGFYDSANASMGSLEPTPTTGTSGRFLLRRASRLLPAGTRSLWVEISGTRASDGGSYCDAYFDKVSVKLRPTD